MATSHRGRSSRRRPRRRCQHGPARAATAVTDGPWSASVAPGRRPGRSNVADPSARPIVAAIDSLIAAGSDNRSDVLAEQLSPRQQDLRIVVVRRQVGQDVEQLVLLLDLSHDVADGNVGLQLVAEEVFDLAALDAA